MKRTKEWVTVNKSKKKRCIIVRLKPRKDLKKILKAFKSFPLVFDTGVYFFDGRKDDPDDDVRSQFVTDVGYCRSTLLNQDDANRLKRLLRKPTLSKRLRDMQYSYKLRFRLLTCSKEP